MRKKWKLILNLEIFLFAFLICALLILLTVKIAVGALADSQTVLTEMEENNLRFEEEKRGEADMEDLEENVKEINKTISETRLFFDQKKDLTFFLESFSQILPVESYLTSFSYQKDSSKISISGFCPNRDKMVELKENIEKREEIKNLSFPSSNWLNPDKFSLSFEINDR